MPQADSNSDSKLSKAGSIFKNIFFGYFSYSTTREFKGDSLYVAIIFRILQLAVFVYVIGYDIISNQSYQSFELVSSTVTTKVKGLGYTSTLNSSNYRMLDTADYVIPSNEFNSIFVMTNFVETRQSRSICDEDPEKSQCDEDSDCEKDVLSNALNGIPTGRCINSTIKQGARACEITAWCPVEIDYRNSKDNLIKNVENYTIFIKNDVHFKRYEKRQQNILPNITSAYIASCFNNPVTDPYCPIFRIGDILEAAEPLPEEREKMLLRGGVIQIEIQWNCNLDVSLDKCKPVYSYERFDLRFSVSSVASGFNFRYADKYEVDGKPYRTLVKAYGLRFIIVVSGKAGKFDFIPLLITVGSGIGLLAIPVIIADCLLLNLTRKRKLYQQLKEYDFKNPNIHEKLANDVALYETKSSNKSAVFSSPVNGKTNGHLYSYPIATRMQSPSERVISESQKF